MLPLGDSWAGLCHTPLESPSEPDEDTLRVQCNLGYARGNCPRFPDGDGPDAVRFSIARDEGATLRLQYVVERDHHPFVHGRLEYSVASASFAASSPIPNLLPQARAYVQSYFHRKTEAHAA
jgi:hypothetical protein